MKMTLLKLSIAAALFPMSAWSDSTIVSSPDKKMIWSASTLDQHPFFGRSACQASILSGRTSDLNLNRQATLEVVALLDQVKYQEPLVLVRVDKAQDLRFTFHKAELKVTIGAIVQKFDLLRADTQDIDQKSQLAALVKLDDRQAVINALKQGSDAEVVLKKNNLVVSSFGFKLRGSTSALSAAERTCNLSITN